MKTKSAKPVKNWTIMSIPGRESDPTDAGKWYAYNRQTLKQILCDDRAEAGRIVTELNGTAN